MSCTAARSCKLFACARAVSRRVKGTLALTGKDPVATDKRMIKIRVCKTQVLLSLVVSGTRCNVKAGWPLQK